MRGFESNHASRLAENPLKRPELGMNKERILGKRRARQTAFINLEDAKQAAASSAAPAAPPTRGEKNSSWKKPNLSSGQRVDASVERMHREVLRNDKFWLQQDDAELQRVPASFDAVEDYIRVFEPLLFEECRAKLLSTYEEHLEMTTGWSHIPVQVKYVDRKERE